jgi:hypothetical protein
LLVVAFVEAARFLGGQLSRIANLKALLPDFHANAQTKQKSAG